MATALSGYGVVKSVRHQVWPGLPDVSTGSRIVTMVRTKEIPRFVSIKGVRCKVWYRGQPLRCDICRAIGHKSAACPDRGRCLRCHKEGHFARTCPDAWNKASAPTVPSVAAPGDEAVQPLDSDVVVPPPPAGSVDEVSALSASDVNVADPTPPEPVDTAMECGDVFPPASQGPLDSQGYLNEDVVDPIVVVSGQGASVPSSDIDSSESGVKLYDEHFSQLDEVASVTSSVVQGILSNGDILSSTNNEIINDTSSEIINNTSSDIINNKASAGNGEVILVNEIANEPNANSENTTLPNVDEPQDWGSIVDSQDVNMSPASGQRKRPSTSSTPRRRPAKRTPGTPQLPVGPSAATRVNASRAAKKKS